MEPFRRDSCLHTRTRLGPVLYHCRVLPFPKDLPLLPHGCLPHPLPSRRQWLYIFAPRRLRLLTILAPCVSFYVNWLFFLDFSRPCFGKHEMRNAMNALDMCHLPAAIVETHLRTL
ncbi:hypothetical protein N656DRAFT_594518 [Canariomyces notabilis]|uniref:Uncharacterized protein n=1 Tax=Canariomyces notabilis TaxID=2074819 RepID=A0AAN6YTY1_9PEZI|nr:hypothetical protein N656DRAFT_594518 [Canariomyces arenarius]